MTLYIFFFLISHWYTTNFLWPVAILSMNISSICTFACTFSELILNIVEVAYSFGYWTIRSILVWKSPFGPCFFNYWKNFFILRDCADWYQKDFCSVYVFWDNAIQIGWEHWLYWLWPGIMQFILMTLDSLYGLKKNTEMLLLPIKITMWRIHYKQKSNSYLKNNNKILAFLLLNLFLWLKFLLDQSWSRSSLIKYFWTFDQSSIVVWVYDSAFFNLLNLSYNSIWWKLSN